MNQSYERIIFERQDGVATLRFHCPDMALFLSSELASYVTGAIIPVDGGAALRGGRDMRASYVPRSAA